MLLRLGPDELRSVLDIRRRLFLCLRYRHALVRADAAAAAAFGASLHQLLTNL